MPSGPNYNPAFNGQWTDAQLLASIQNLLISTIKAQWPATVFPDGPTYNVARATERTEAWFYGSIQNLMVVIGGNFLTVSPSLRVALTPEQTTTNRMLSSTQNIMVAFLGAYLLNPLPPVQTYQSVGVGQWTDANFLVSIQNLTRHWAASLAIALPVGANYNPLAIGESTENRSLTSIQNILTQFPLA